MNRRLLLQRGSLAFSVCLLTLCDLHPPYWKTANMTPQSHRVQTLLQKLEPRCFGRFMIDLPEGVHTAWGNSTGFKVAPGRAAELDTLVSAMEDERRKEKRYPLTKNLNLYLETRNGPGPKMKHVISQRDFASEDFLRIDTYYAMGTDLVVTQSSALTETLPDILAEVEDTLRRMRPRTETEIPTDPGMCIENAFIADRPNAANEEVSDFLSVGYRFKEPSDIHLSIDIQAANDEWAKPGLEKKLADSEREALFRGNPNLYGFLTTLRRDHREVPAWSDGFEFLTRTHGNEASRPHHDFWMIFAGQKDVLLRPYVDIRLASGVADGAAGGTVPTLTDEETLALWDALTSTLRVRPTTSKRAAAAADAEVPLGTLAATGSACPRTGLWRCAEEGLPVQGGRERWFRAGEALPTAVLLGDASVWQRLKGEQPSHASQTVWKLVALNPPDAR